MSNVTLTPGLTLKAALYPVDNPQADLLLRWPQPVTLSASGGAYAGRFTLPAFMPTGFVHVWVEGEQPRRETVAAFGIEGNAGGGARATGGAHATGGGGARATGGGGARATGGGGARATAGGGARATGGGFIRTGHAAVATSEGDVLFSDPALTFGEGQFLLLQQVPSPPDPPAGTTFVGTSYRFTASTINPPLIGPQASVSFSYLGAEVPAGEESGIRVYYRNPDAARPAWVELPTRLDTTVNVASAPYQGPGIYALLSSLTSVLDPGWNLYGYPAQLAQPPSEAFASIAGQYNQVVGYDPRDTTDPWKVYSPDVPGWVNDLSCLHFSRGYWIFSTNPATTTLKLRSIRDAGEANPCATVQARRAWPAWQACQQAPVRQRPTTAWYRVGPVSR